MEEWQGESFWLPEPGEYLVGGFRGVERAEGKFGVQDVMRVLDAEGAMWKIRVTAVLKSLLQEQKPEIDQQVGIKYFGKSAKGYHRWGLVLGDQPDIADPELPEPAA